MKIFGDGLTDDYMKRAVGVGQVHARIGLEPKWYVGGYALILEEMIYGMISPGLLRFVPHDRLPADVQSTWVPDLEPIEGPDAWHPMDALYAPLQGPDGALVGVLGVDLPIDGRRPDELARQVLEMYAVHAGLLLRRGGPHCAVGRVRRGLHVRWRLVVGDARQRRVGRRLHGRDVRRPWRRVDERPLPARPLVRRRLGCSGRLRARDDERCAWAHERVSVRGLRCVVLLPGRGHDGGDQGLLARVRLPRRRRVPEREVPRRPLLRGQQLGAGAVRRRHVPERHGSERVLDVPGVVLLRGRGYRAAGGMPGRSVVPCSHDAAVRAPVPERHVF